MDRYELIEKFDKIENEYLHFERVNPKRHSRPDLHAMLLLAELFPDEGDIIAGAEHDYVYFDVDLDDEENLLEFTDKIIIELVRCGFGCDEDGGIFTFA